MRVVIADEQKLFRDGVRPYLSGLNPEVQIFEAGSFDEAVLVAEKARGPDLILLSQAMPGMNGMSAIHSFREKYPTAKLVLLTMIADAQFLVAAISAESDGVILKTISGDSMLNALRLVMSGEHYVSFEMVVALATLVSSVMPTKLRRSDKGKPFTPAGLQHVKFSAAEIDVVPLLLDGLSNKVISQCLGIEETAVKGRLRGLYKKMGASNRAQAIWSLLAAGNHRSI